MPTEYAARSGGGLFGYAPERNRDRGGHSHTDGLRRPYERQRQQNGYEHAHQVEITTESSGRVYQQAWVSPDVGLYPMNTLLIALFAVQGLSLAVGTWLYLVYPRRISHGNGTVAWAEALPVLLLLAFPVFAFAVVHRPWMGVSVAIYLFLFAQEAYAGWRKWRQVKRLPNAVTFGFALLLLVAATLAYIRYSTVPLSECAFCVREIGK